MNYLENEENMAYRRVGAVEDVFLAWLDAASDLEE